MHSHIFHLSFPVDDLSKARRFYGELLGCAESRVEPDRIDFNFFGNHLVAQLSPEEASHRSATVGREAYPLRHFGVIVAKDEFDRIAQKLTAAQVKFVIPPENRHGGTVREQSTMFVIDPCGNGLEFKSLPEPWKVFG